MARARARLHVQQQTLAHHCSTRMAKTRTLIRDLNRSMPGESGFHCASHIDLGPHHKSVAIAYNFMGPALQFTAIAVAETYSALIQLMVEVSPGEELR